MRFAKYHGIGNDFLVVDLRSSPEEVSVWRDHGVAICDRRFGVGGDGVLAILPGVVGDARMEVINSDGSIAEMCGNGLRCVVRYLHDRGGLGRTMTIETNAGPLACEVDGQAITVRLGRPRIDRGAIPMTGEGRCIDEPYDGLRITGVNTGNPHLVAFVDSAAEAKRLARELGPTFERHPWFPLKANVEFAHARSRSAIDVHVWERACGLTLACGTGASATAVAAVLTGRSDTDVPIEIVLPGGRLEIVVHRDLADVSMTGPATHVFDGELDPRELARRPT